VDEERAAVLAGVVDVMWGLLSHHQCAVLRELANETNGTDEASSQFLLDRPWCSDSELRDLEHGWIRRTTANTLEFRHDALREAVREHLQRERQAARRLREALVAATGGDDETRLSS
jgi:hypothetical protein